ncbi:MAG: hypothetical protein KBB83_06685 [Alphaproteobacteria bacterium]|jgi:hypothetical protein|nr:hypothetical protein [Alphaproteobacteria bacterium]
MIAENIGHYLAEATALAVIVLGTMCVCIGIIIVLRYLWGIFAVTLNSFIGALLKVTGTYGNILYFILNKRKVLEAIKRIKSEEV